MRKAVTIGIVALVACVAIQSSALGLEKKNHNYNEWTKGIFFEVVTVIGKQVTYVTDIRYIGDLAKCRNATFGTGPVPTNTLLNISALAFPEMMIEVDVTAVVP